MRRVLGGAALLGALAFAAAPAQAQRPSIGIGAEFMGYSFDDELGADAAQLFLVPLAVRVPVVPGFTLDLYTAWAQGKVEEADTEYTLDGLVDTRLKASWQATPWALLSLGMSLPTGNATHDGNEAVVASVLSNDLLGFREATWGTGFGLTSSVATAIRAGEFGIGLAGSYSVRGEFEPRSELDLTYRPGNEARVRVGFDRNIGTNTLTGGVTLSTFSQDQRDGRNLFQAGNRIRGDLTYAFRAGAGLWSVWLADVWRENGDLTLDVVDDDDVLLGDTTVTTASQNLVVAGVRGTVGVGGSYVVRPQVDLRLQQREEADGREEGSGWILGVGADFPLRLFGGYDFFPKARVLFGSIQDAEGVSRSLTGGEVTFTVRWSF